METTPPTRKVRLLATLRDMTGRKEIEVPMQEGETVRDFVRHVEQLYPGLKGKILDDAGELTHLVHILVEGRNIIWLKGLDTPLRMSDELVMLPPTAGG
jgi:sulfur-carrier protein